MCDASQGHIPKDLTVHDLWVPYLLTHFPWTQRKDICWHTFFGLKTKEIWMLFRYTMYHFTFTNISQNISFHCVDIKRELSPHVLSVYELTFSDCLTAWSGDMMIVHTCTWYTQSHWPQVRLSHLFKAPHQLLAWQSYLHHRWLQDALPSRHPAVLGPDPHLLLHHLAILLHPHLPLLPSGEHQLGSRGIVFTNRCSCTIELEIIWCYKGGDLRHAGCRQSWTLSEYLPGVVRNDWFFLGLLNCSGFDKLVYETAN